MSRFVVRVSYQYWLHVLLRYLRWILSSFKVCLRKGYAVTNAGLFVGIRLKWLLILLLLSYSHTTNKLLLGFIMFARSLYAIIIGLVHMF